MQFWQIEADYSQLSTTNEVEGTCEPCSSLLGERCALADRWTNITLQFYPTSPAQDKDGKSVDLQGNPITPIINTADFPAFYPGIFLCSSAAQEVLLPWLSDYVENLHVTVIGHPEYKLIRPVTFLDCLDPKHAIVEERVMKDGKIWRRVKKYAFDSNLVGEVPLFKTVYNGRDTFCSDVFKERIEEAKLTGLKFIPVGKTARAIFRDGLMTVEYE